MAAITVRELEAAKPQQSEYKLTIDRGLYLRIAPDGIKTWHVRYSINSKQKQSRLARPFGKGLGFSSLAEARIEATQIRSLAKAGIDHLEQLAESQKKQALTKTKLAAENLTLAALFAAWVVNGTGRKDAGKDLHRTFAKDILPSLGEIPLKNVTANDIREALRKVVSRNANRLAVMLLSDIKQMFRWGSDEQPWRKLLIEGDPSKRIEAKTLVSPDYDLANERDRVLSDAELKKLAVIFQTMQSDYQNAPNKRIAVRPVSEITQLVLWLCLSMTCRIGELLQARWEHVNFASSELFIPKENSKDTKTKRSDWIVQLSDFSLRHFKRLHEITGHSVWCFPASNKINEHVCLKSVSKQVGDRQISSKNRKPLKGRRNDDSLVLSAEKWTPHDLRRTGSTLMQSLGVEESIRERCLNHAVGGKIGRIYGRHTYEKEKREAWQKLGTYLTNLLTSQSSIQKEMKFKSPELGDMFSEALKNRHLLSHGIPKK